MLTAHQLVDIGPRLHAYERTSAFHSKSKSLAILFPDLQDEGADLFEVGLSVRFTPALRGDYHPSRGQPWPYFRRESFALSALTSHLPAILRESAIEAYIQHIDDMSCLIGSRLNYDRDTVRMREIREKLAQLNKVRGEFLARYVLAEAGADGSPVLNPGDTP